MKVSQKKKGALIHQTAEGNLAPMILGQNAVGQEEFKRSRHDSVAVKTDGPRQNPREIYDSTQKNGMNNTIASSNTLSRFDRTATVNQYGDFNPNELNKEL